MRLRRRYPLHIYMNPKEAMAHVGDGRVTCALYILCPCKDQLIHGMAHYSEESW
jgi:hypothetical protein